MTPPPFSKSRPNEKQYKKHSPFPRGGHKHRGPLCTQQIGMALSHKTAHNKLHWESAKREHIVPIGVREPPFFVRRKLIWGIDEKSGAPIHPSAPHFAFCSGPARTSELWPPPPKCSLSLVFLSFAPGPHMNMEGPTFNQLFIIERSYRLIVNNLTEKPGTRRHRAGIDGVC